MSQSFYIYETQYISKCLRCKENKPLEDHEFCEPCINEMIMPGFSAPFVSEEMEKEIRRSNEID